MAVPDFQTLMRPVLEALESAGQMSFRELVDATAARVGLDEDERNEQISSGQPVVANRVGWVVTYMVQAGAVHRPRRGVAEITGRGRKLLATGPERITSKVLEQFPEFVEFRDRSRSASGDGRPSGTTGATSAEVDETPSEQVKRAERDANAAVEAELLARIQAQPPEFLERLVLKLLVAMGYGDRVEGGVEHRGRSGDEGIDGVIRQDPLGLELVYLQAKRYAPNITVGRPDMQAFVGALHGAQASRGIFITTSRFSSTAIEYAERVGLRIIPIDGPRLAALMRRHGVGVQPDVVATLYRVDEDFFEYA